MAEKEKTIIFFVDDETQVCRAVSQMLSTQLENCEVRTFDDADSCLKVLRNHECDLVIADVNLPGTSGLELLERVKWGRPQLSVLLFSGYADVPMAVRAIKSGAIDFIEKPLDEATFLPLVRKAVKNCHSDDINKGKTLTRSEIRILREVVKGKSNREIAVDLRRSVRTVENHRHRLMHKLGAKNAVDLVKKAVNIGFTVED
ncbi:MAG TPA: response regulator transcription factor [Planctomycetes bacterium]|nr:response regulator transcription factor [Planctomycetota bacterium]HIJ71752.1 response regulator transcription factor [Planctomycetota bacterium]